MADLPWYAFSPSPWTLVFWAILAIYIVRKILSYYPMLAWDFKTKWKTRIHLYTTALFIIGFFVLSTDNFYILGALWKWGPLFPESQLQLIFCLGRNIVGMIFCRIFFLEYVKDKIIVLNRRLIIAYGINAMFFIVWFAWASSPALTDWTFAIRHDYPAPIIQLSFFISHFIGRVIWLLILVNCWARWHYD